MIVGVGVDIVEIDRISKALNKNGNFISKTFTENEQEYMRGKKSMDQHAAGMFAAKEAVAKALGTGFRGFFLKDIEVIRDDKGKPSIILHNGAKDIAQQLGAYIIHLSISHEKSNAIAYAVLEVR